MEAELPWWWSELRSCPSLVALLLLPQPHPCPPSLTACRTWTWEPQRLVPRVEVLWMAQAFGDLSELLSGNLFEELIEGTRCFPSEN